MSKEALSITLVFPYTFGLIEQWGKGEVVMMSWWPSTRSGDQKTLGLSLRAAGQDCKPLSSLEMGGNFCLEDIDLAFEGWASYVLTL